MPIDIQLERLYDRIELVRGAGNVQRGTLCIMSFVAYLAGERHTDRPKTASPVIRAFAIQLNDGAIDEWRQELKPFAPKIIGTNDGREQERADILFRAVVDEILPVARADFGAGLPESNLMHERGLANPYPSHAVVDRREAYSALAWNIMAAHTQMDYLTMATWTGNILAVLSRCSQTGASKRWFWCKALEILDRLCDVGAEDRVPAVSHVRLEQLQNHVDGRLSSEVRAQNLIENIKKAKGVLPRLYKAVLHHVA